MPHFWDELENGWTAAPSREDAVRRAGAAEKQAAFLRNFVQAGGTCCTASPVKELDQKELTAGRDEVPEGRGPDKGG